MGCSSGCGWASCGAILLFVVVGVPLLIVFGKSGNTDPTFTVEGAAVKAFNLTSDNHLFCIFDFSILAHNRDSKHHVTYRELDMEVRKGRHHKLADDVLIPFSQEKGSDAVVAVEAVGLYVQLEDKIAREVTADRAAGSTAVNMYFSGRLGGGDWISVVCRNVKVSFQPGGEFVKVDCGVTVTTPDAPSD